MQIANRMEMITPFYVMELLRRAKQLEAEGRDIIHMEIGEPDFATPEPITNAGLAYIKDSLLTQFDGSKYADIIVEIPVMTVLATDVFDTFMSLNNFYDIVNSDMTDERIALAFQKGEFPYEYIGDLRGLIVKVNSPLAVRSSSLLEDAINHPFAGVYGTKMIPNNQPDADT